MSEEKQLYSVSELADALNVARTTINDWLNRYADYLESEQRGKRKVYTRRTCEVLREVAQLREAGKSSIEIDQALAASHPINPEVTAPNPESAAAAETPPSTLPAPPEPAAENLPALLRWSESAQQFTRELAVLVEGLKARQAEQEEMLHLARRKSRRLAVFIALLLLLAAALAVAGGVFLTERGRTREAELARNFTAEREAAEKRHAEARLEAQERSRREREELLAELAERRQELAAEIAALKTDYAGRMEAAEKAMSQRSESEIALLKEESQRRQAEFQRQLEELEAHNGRLTAALEAAAARLTEAAGKMAAPPEKEPEKEPENLQNTGNGGILPDTNTDTETIETPQGEEGI